MVDAAEQIIHGDNGERAATIHVASRRFGSFDVPADRVLTFPQGLIGFPDASRFVILDHRPGSPFKWMLSLDDPELGFAVANPCELVAGYEPPVELAARLLGVAPEDVALFVLVTIPSDPTAMTVNLMAPVVVDLKTRRARQLVLDGSRLETRHRVLVAPQSAQPQP
jgi:flagellar assembly factor FliW